MFRRRKQKRYSLINTFHKRVMESVKSEMFDESEPVIVDHRYDNVPFLPRGQFNSSIPTKLLNQLPLYLQRCWERIDLNEYFAEPPKETESPDNPLSRVSRESERPLDVFELNEDRKNKIKAITFGEVKQQRGGEGTSNRI